MGYESVGAKPSDDSSPLFSALEVLHFLFNVFPLIGVFRRRLPFDDRLPRLGQLGVQRLELLLVGRHVIFGKNRLDWAFRDAQRAIDAFVGVDDKEIWTLAKAVDRANIDAIGIFAANATLCYYVGHPENRATSCKDLNSSRSLLTFEGRDRPSRLSYGNMGGNTALSAAPAQRPA